MSDVQKFKVKAPPGIKCPMEGVTRETISDAEFVEVPATMFYRRLIEDGSLILEPAPAPKSGTRK